MGNLNRMTQFKEKSVKDKGERSPASSPTPVLMAADMLLYKATEVPVGDDQMQHVELAREIAQKFNNDYGMPGGEPVFFPLPEPLIGGPAARIMSLRDGTEKMSKSDPSDQSRINLTDDKDAIAMKIRRAKTDLEPLPHAELTSKTRPEADNLISIYAALSGQEKAAGARALRLGVQTRVQGLRPSLRFRCSRRSPPRCASSWPTRTISTASCATAPSARRRSPPKP